MQLTEAFLSRPVKVGDVIDDGSIGMVILVTNTSARVVWVSEAITLEPIDHVMQARRNWETREDRP